MNKRPTFMEYCEQKKSERWNLDTLIKQYLTDYPEQSTGVEMIAYERERQIKEEGYDAAHDDEHTAFQLSSMAACYIVNAQDQNFVEHTHYDHMGPISRFQIREVDTENWIDGYPFDMKYREKMRRADTITSLAKAGASIAAEIDRLKRLENG